MALMSMEASMCCLNLSFCIYSLTSLNVLPVRCLHYKNFHAASGELKGNKIFSSKT